MVWMILLAALQTSPPDSLAELSDRSLKLSVEVAANVHEVWKAWTTEEGVRTFFAPQCKVQLYPGGAYEMYFIPDAPEGSRGGEGNVVLAVQPDTLLSFTWNAPPQLDQVRNQRTHVSIYFKALDKNRTKVLLVHDGWGRGGQWDDAFRYFESAWGKVVLPRLQKRFIVGPLGW